MGPACFAQQNRPKLLLRASFAVWWGRGLAALQSMAWACLGRWGLWVWVSTAEWPAALKNPQLPEQWVSLGQSWRWDASQCGLPRTV